MKLERKDIGAGLGLQRQVGRWSWIVVSSLVKILANVDAKQKVLG